MVTDTGQLVLVVEDEKVLASLLKRRLEQDGFRVVVSYDGKSGLEEIKAQKPDLVLLDMLLPKMSGFDVLEALSKDKIIPDLPIIVISSSGQQVEIDRAKSLGIRDYLIKLNFDPEDVIYKVKNILSKTGGIDPAVPTKENTPLDQKDNDATDVDSSSDSDTGGSNLTADGEEILPGEETIKGSILTVEDDPLLSGLLVRNFEKAQYKVFSAANVPLAREIIENNEIDIICLDLVLPGVDGFTFLEEVKNNTKFKDIPILVLSNLGQKEDIDRAMGLGAHGYLLKATLSPSEIVTKVEETLEG
jgi:DNA-binding response OmpR family regulator